MLFDGVFADRMNSGLDWMWVEMLTVMVDWIGLDWILKNGPTDISVYFH